MKHLSPNKIPRILLLVGLAILFLFLSNNTAFFDENTSTETNQSEFIADANLPTYTEGTPVNFNIEWSDEYFDSAIITLTSNGKEYKIGYDNKKCSSSLPAGKYTITNIEVDDKNYIFDVIGMSFNVQDSTEKQNIKLIIGSTFKFDVVHFIKTNFFFIIIFIVYIILYWSSNKKKIIEKVLKVKQNAEEAISNQYTE